MITFSQGDAAKVKSKQLSEIGSRSKHGESAFISKNIEQTDKTNINTLDAFVDGLYYFIFWKWIHEWKMFYNSFTNITDALGTDSNPSHTSLISVFQQKNMPNLKKKAK